MRDVISLINNEKDFENFILELSVKMPPQTRNTEVRYERHPVRISPSGPEYTANSCN
jgi:Rho GTPase-activating protein RGD1